LLYLFAIFSLPVAVRLQTKNGNTALSLIEKEVFDHYYSKVWG